MLAAVVLPLFPLIYSALARREGPLPLLIPRRLRRAAGCAQKSNQTLAEEEINLKPGETAANNLLALDGKSPPEERRPLFLPRQGKSFLCFDLCTMIPFVFHVLSVATNRLLHFFLPAQVSTS